ncbi:MAG: hypothetical protein QOK28_917 [Actinomycetota bacterium]|jgi:hypothetical protein
MTDIDPMKKIEITWDDLSGADVDRRIEDMKSAREIPLSIPVGEAPTTTAGAWWRGTAMSLAIAGVVGGFAGWAVQEVMLSPDSASHHWYGDSNTVSTILFISIVAVALGCAISSWEGVQARSTEKALSACRRAFPFLVGGGIVGGWIAQHVYESMLRDAIERAFRSGQSEEDALNALRNAMHAPRGIAFAIACAAVGGALGAATQSSKRAVNGAVGGAIGGFIGGFLFDYIGEWLNADSGVMPRLVALVFAGALVGGAIGLIETARRDHWLEIVSGGMAGKQFILYHEATTVGASPSAHVTLIKDPGIAPEHAVLSRSGGSLRASSLTTSTPLLVNGQPIAERVLADGDLLQFGQTVIRYRQKSAADPVHAPQLT